MRCCTVHVLASRPKQQDGYIPHVLMLSWRSATKMKFTLFLFSRPKWRFIPPKLRNQYLTVSNLFHLGPSHNKKILLSTLGNFHVKWPGMVLTPVCVSRNTDLLSPCEQTVTKPRLLRPCVLPFILSHFQKSWRRRGRDMGQWLSLNRKSSPPNWLYNWLPPPDFDCVAHNGTEAIVYLYSTFFMSSGEARRTLKQAAELWELQTLSFGEE